MEFTDVLKDRQTNFKSNGEYNQDAMPKVYAYYLEYIKAGNFPYLSRIVDFILTKELVNADLLAYLKTEVYLASQQNDREKTTRHNADMINNGWLPLTIEAVKKESAQGNKIIVSATTHGAIFDGLLDSIFKPFIGRNGYCYIMKPRATRKGYLVSNLSDAFYKPLNK